VNDSKRKLLIRLANVVIIVLALLYYNQVLSLNQELAKANKTIQTLSEASAGSGSGTATSGNYKNGTYQGSAQGFGGTITVEVTIENGNISDIQVVSAAGEDATYYNMAINVLDDIMSKQSADVDTVSGATYSSTGLINATKEALGKAKK
jgi:uncharacterized protein with FMN-binding domain